MSKTPRLDDSVRPEPFDARAARLEENRRLQAAAIAQRLQEAHNRRVADLLTWWANTRESHS